MNVAIALPESVITNFASQLVTALPLQIPAEQIVIKRRSVYAVYLRDLISIRQCVQIENRAGRLGRGDITAFVDGMIPTLRAKLREEYAHSMEDLDTFLYPHGFIYTAMMDDVPKMHIIQGQYALL